MNGSHDLSMNPDAPSDRPVLLSRIRICVAVIIAGLVLSGITAFPLEWQLDTAVKFTGTDGAVGSWLERARVAVAETNARHPLVFYGTDWLAFGHFAIAVLFVGAWIDPVKNVWLFRGGLVVCALVFPFALVAGGFRGIPLWHRLVDCSFGILGAVPMFLGLKWARCLIGRGSG
jgi:hypothetical protein